MLGVLLLLNIINVNSLDLECGYYQPIVSTNQVPRCSDGSRPCVKKGGKLSCDCPLVGETDTNIYIYIYRRHPTNSKVPLLSSGTRNVPIARVT